MKQHDLFPSTIYVDNINNAVYINQTLLFIQDEIQNNKIINAHSIRNGWQSQKDLYNIPHFAVLADYILKKIQIDVLQGDKTKSLIMTDMWVNHHGHQGFNHVHVHPNSWYSGVVYLKCSDKTGNICFADPRPGAEMTHVVSPMVVSPKPGDLILFPSFLPHWVEPNADTAERISISFNISIE